MLNLFKKLVVICKKGFSKGTEIGLEYLDENKEEITNKLKDKAKEIVMEKIDK